MAASPQYKIYTRDNEYIGCTKYASDAAALVSLYGEGATIRRGHTKDVIAWTEGKDGNASDSYCLTAKHVVNCITDLDRKFEIYKLKQQAYIEKLNKEKKS